MKLTVNNKLLIRAAERCSAATDTRSAHPHTGKIMLSGVIHADGEQCLQAFATDLILQVDTAVEAQVETEGSVAVDCRRLMSVASAMPAGPVTLTATSGRLLLRCSGARSYAMPVIPVDLFPAPVEPGDDARRCSLSSELLGRAIARVQHCVDASTSREHLRGVYIDVADQTLNAVAIGAYMMAFASAPTDGEPWAGLLPLGALRLVGSLGPENEQLTLLLDGDKVFVEAKDTLIGGLLPRGNFPPWRAGLENLARARVARVPAVLLQDAIKAVCAGRSPGDSDLGIEAVAGKLQLSLVGDECRAEDEVAVDSLDRAEATWLLDPAFLLDTIKGADADFVLEDYGDGAIVVTDDGYLGMLAGRRARAEPPLPERGKAKGKPGNGDGKGQAGDVD